MDDYISTKKKRVKYTFVTPKREEQFVNPDVYDYYYQLCSYPMRKSDKYQMRRFLIDGDGKIVDVKEYLLNKDQCKKLVESKRSHQYKCYPSYDLSGIPPPSGAEILMCKSNILNTSYDYSGFAPF